MSKDTMGPNGKVCKGFKWVKESSLDDMTRSIWVDMVNKDELRTRVINYAKDKMKPFLDKDNNDVNVEGLEASLSGISKQLERYKDKMQRYEDEGLFNDADELQEKVIQLRNDERTILDKLEIHRDVGSDGGFFSKVLSWVRDGKIEPNMMVDVQAIEDSNFFGDIDTDSGPDIRLATFGLMVASSILWEDRQMVVDWTKEELLSDPTRRCLEFMFSRIEPSWEHVEADKANRKDRPAETKTYHKGTLEKVDFSFNFGGECILSEINATISIVLDRFNDHQVNLIMA